MTAPLRPHVVQLAAPITSITPLSDGGYAVATRKNVQLVDAQLVPGPVIAEYGEVTELADGRLVVASAPAFAGKVGALAKIEVGEYCREVVPTETGFIAVGSDRVVFDVAGARTTVKLPKDGYPGVARWRDGIAVADKSGLRLLGPGGAEVARSSEVYLSGTPCIAGDWIVVPGLGALHVFDATGRLAATLETKTGDVVPFAGGVLGVPKGFDETPLDAYEVGDDGAIAKRWSIPSDADDPIRKVVVIGERLAIVVGDAVWIADDGGEVLARIREVGHVNAIAAFEDGIVVCGQRTVWWRPGSGETELAHDGALHVAVTAPVGLAASENDVLLIWRTDVQGPEPVPLETDLPMNVPIVVDGSPLVVVGTHRFTLEVKSHGQTHRRSPAYTAWRHQTTRDQAMPLLERLVARTFDGPLPAVPAGARHEQIAALAQRPLAETVDLVGRGLFALASLDGELAELAQSARPAFFTELAGALGTRSRLLLAAVRARKLELRAPRLVAGYDYLGTFTTSGNLTVGDPCYLGKKSGGLTHRVAAAEGIWHVFVRALASAPQYNAELAVVHEDAFDVYASDAVTSIGVDAGLAGVFDKACPKPNLDLPVDDGVLSGQAAVASSGYGDGMYPVFAGRHAGKVAKLRIVFADEKPEVDHLRATPAGGAAKPYSASAKFAVGDTLEHVKFGLGSVIRVGGDGKIDVRFADATRTLVHGKK